MYELELVIQPSSQQVKYLEENLRQYNIRHSEEDNHQPFAIFLKNDEGRIVGGLSGGTYWGWLHIDLLWLEEESRGHNYGKALIESAEAEARRRGCKHAQVDTHDFQAPGFYKKLGYTVWGVLEDLPPGHQRFYLKKDL